MRHELAGYIDVDYLYIKVRREFYYASSYAVEPAVNEKIVACGCKDKTVEDVGHSNKSPHHDDGQHAGATEQCPSKYFQMIPKGHRALLFLFQWFCLTFVF